MRIAIFSEVYWPMVSGVSTTLTRTATALMDRGHAVRVYSARYPLGQHKDRPEVHRSPGGDFFLSPEVQWAAPNQAEVNDDLRRFDPDVVHLATEWSMGYAGLRAAKALGAPIIASAHTDYEQYAARYRLTWATQPGWVYLRWFYRQAALVLAPTAGYRRHLETRGVPHTGLWTRGVDTERFGPAYRSDRYRAELGLGADDLIVSYVGRIAPEKGIDALLDAWDTLHARRPEAHLVFTGTGLMEEAIRRRQLPRVHLTGMKRGDDLATAYASADVFVMPSVTETFGNVTLEAMASGVPVLAVAAGGILDFGRPNDNCLFAAPGQSGQLAGGIDRLLGDGELRRRLSAGGRTTALTRRWAPIFDSLVSDYLAVASADVAEAA